MFGHEQVPRTQKLVYIVDDCFNLSDRVTDLFPVVVVQILALLRQALAEGFIVKLEKTVVFDWCEFVEILEFFQALLCFLQPRNIVKRRHCQHRMYAFALTCWRALCEEDLHRSRLRPLHHFQTAIIRRRGQQRSCLTFLVDCLPELARHLPPLRCDLRLRIRQPIVDFVQVFFDDQLDIFLALTQAGSSLELRVLFLTQQTQLRFFALPEQTE